MDTESRPRSGEQYRLLIDKITDGIVVTELNGIVRFANPAAAALLGCGKDELLGRPIGLPEIRPGCVRLSLDRRDGKVSYAELRAAPIEWQKEPAYLLCLREDPLQHEPAVDRRQQPREPAPTGEAYRHETRLLQLILDSMTDGVFVCDRDGKYVFINQTARQLLGSTLAGIVPEAWAQHFGLFQKNATKPVSGIESPLVRAIRGEFPEEVEFFIRNQQYPEGRIVTQTARPVGDSEGGLYGGVVVMRDITDRRRTETLLLRTEKLATAGRMAATIAHEINNPLAATMNSLFLVLQDQSLSESSRQKLMVAEKELQRIAILTRQALGFYKEAGHPTSVKLSELVDEVLDLQASRIKDKSIHVVRNCHGAPRVLAIEGELRQVVSNIVTNSIDAISRNGTLHVRIASSTQFFGGRRMIRLTVADTGKGISPENLGRIFEPFFTTKLSIGTGLGLWVAEELVRRYDGKIRVRSRLGKGTVFSVWIPCGRE